MKNVKIAVFGLNHGYKFASDAMKIPGVELVAVAGDNELSERRARELDVPLYKNYEDLVHECNLDGAIITLPNRLHKEAVEVCANKGLHVLVEKPIVDLTYMMLGTLGIGIVLQNLAIIIWGPTGMASPYPIKNEPWMIGGISISPYTLVIIAASALVVVVLELFLHKTKLGLAMRASAQEREMSMVLGMNVNLMNALTLGIGSALGAIAGVLVGPVLYVSPEMSSSVGISGFAAAILGGFGSIPGAIVGGLIFGVLQTMAATQVSEWSQVIAFLLFVLVLIFKPSGIVGERMVDKI